MSWIAAALGVSSLAFFRLRPTRVEERAVRMRRILRHSRWDDRRDSFRKHITHRRPLLDSHRIVVRVTGNTNSGLPRNQQFGEVGMSLVKLYIIGGNLGQDFSGLIQTLKLPCQTYKQFDVTGLSDQTVLPPRIGKIFQCFWLLALLN